MLATQLENRIANGLRRARVGNGGVRISESLGCGSALLLRHPS